MLRHARRVTWPGPGGGRRGHRRRPGAHREHLDDGRVVVAAAGVPVVKHGNRAASSACGAADVLEALGVAIDLPPDAVAASVAEAGHRLLLRAGVPPGDAPRRAVAARAGRADRDERARSADQPGPAAGRAGRLRRPRLAPVMAEVFAGPRASALVVRGDDGLDELTTTTTSTVWVVGGGEVRRETSTRGARGAGGDAGRTCAAATPAGNAGVFRRLLAGSAGRCATRCCSTPRARWWRSTGSRAAGWRTALRWPRWSGRRRGRLRGGGERLLARWVASRRAGLRAACLRPAPAFVQESEAERREGRLGVGPRVRAEGDVGVGARTPRPC